MSKPAMTDRNEAERLEDNIATVAFHLGQLGAKLSVRSDKDALMVDPGEVLKEISRRLSAPSPSLRSGWQPIETAPKDEMFIYYENRIGSRMIGLAYLARDGEWRDSEGNWSTRLNPSHWMPLPATPEPRP